MLKSDSFIKRYKISRTYNKNLKKHLSTIGIWATLYAELISYNSFFYVTKQISLFLKLVVYFKVKFIKNVSYRI